MGFKFDNRPRVYRGAKQLQDDWKQKNKNEKQKSRLSMLGLERKPISKQEAIRNLAEVLGRGE